MATGDDTTGDAEDLNSKIEAAAALNEQYKKVIESYSHLKDDVKILKALNDELTQSEKDLAAAKKAGADMSSVENQMLLKHIDDLRGAIATLGAFKKANDDLKETFIDVSEAMGVLSGTFGKFGSIAADAYSNIDKFKKKQEEIKKQQLAGVISPEEVKKLKEMNMALAGMGIASKILGPAGAAFDKILAKTIELATAEVDAERNMQKLYHTTESAAKSFADIESSTAGTIGSLNEIGIHTGTLYKTFEDLRGEFLLVRDDAGTLNKELIASAAVLEKVGIAAKDTGAVANTLSRVFKENAADAANFAAHLNEIGVQAGLGPGELVTTFNELSPQLLKITGGTSNLTQTMNDLAYMSRQTGIEIGRIVDFASGFDTFEGAADRVGKLNAILGGDFLNVMDLMAAESPAERFKMVTDAINEQGKAFNDLTYYERLALAEAGGFKDVGELAVAMSGQFNDFGDSLSKTQEDYVAAAEKAKDFQTFQEQIEATMVSLAKQPGFSDAVIGAINSFLVFMQWVAENGSLVLSFIIAFKSAQIGLAVAQLLVAKSSITARAALGWGGLLAVIVAIGTILAIGMSPPVNETMMVFAAAIIAVGVAAKIGGKNLNMGLVKVMLALGAALFMAAAVIALAAEGIGSMADSISKLDGPQLDAFNNALIGLVGTLALFTTGIVLLGIFATGPQMLGILGIGAAFLMIGVAIGVAAAGMGVFAAGVGMLVESVANGVATMTDSFIKLFDTGVGGGALLGMAAGMYAMAGSLTVFAAAMVILTPAIMMFQGAMAVGKLLGVGPKGDEIESFSRMVESLAAINPDNLTKTVEQVKQLREEMSNMMDSPDMVKDFTDMLKVFERDMKLAYDINTKSKADQKAVLTITSPITVKIDDSTSLTGRIDERVLAKMNFTRT